MEAFGHGAAAIFQMPPISLKIQSLTQTCCDNTAVEVLYNFKRQKRIGNLPEFPEHTYEPVDESETNLKNPEGVDLNCMRNFGNQNERNTDFDRVSMLLDFLCEENMKCKKLRERNSILEKEVQDLKAELESLTEIFLQKESSPPEVNEPYLFKRLF